MPLLVLFTVVFTLCMTAVMIAGRPERGTDARMAARFAKIQRGGVGLDAAQSGALGMLLREGSATSDGTSMSRFRTFLFRLTTTLHLDALLLQAGSRMSTDRLLSLCGVAAIVGSLVALVLFHGFPFASPLGLLAGGLPIFAVRAQGKRRLRAFEKRLPDVIDMMARSLRAGHSMTAALSIVAEEAAEPARSEFGEVFRQQKFGLPLRDGLMQLLARVPSQDLRVLVTGILVQRDTGGNLTQILDRTGRVIRERVKLQGELRVHTAQGRMTGWILCALPVVMLVLINLINPGYSNALTGTPFGRKLIYAGAFLLTGGAFMINRIVGSIEV